MNQLLDNTSNSKVNSKMETKEPESSENLIPETNMENVKSALNVDSGVVPTNVTERDLPPLRFHRFHGEYVKMSKDYSTAQIVAPKIQSDPLYLHKRKFIVFSSRPIAINEKVYLRLEKDTRIRVDSVEFGFLDCDPNTLTELKFWERKLKFEYHSHGFNSEAGILHFYVKPSGEVCIFMNDMPKLLTIFEKVNINTPLWAVIKIPYNVTTVKFIDSPKENQTEELKPSSVEKPSPTTTNTLTSQFQTDLGKNNQKWDIKVERTKLRADEKADFEKKTVENKGTRSTALGGGSEVAPTNVIVQDLHPVWSHRGHGICIKVAKAYRTARVEISETSEIQLDQLILCNNNYILLSSRPIAIDEKVYIHLEKVPKSFQDLVGFGLSNHNTNSLKPWHSYAGQFKYFSKSFIGKDNIFHFRVKPSGELCFFRNDEHIGSLDVKNIKTPSWAVIELTHINETEELRPWSVEKPSPPITNTLTSRFQTDLVKNNQKWEIKEEETKLRANFEMKTVENEGNRSTALGGGIEVAPTNVTVQDLHIWVSKVYRTARVEISETSEIQLDQLTLYNNNNYILLSSRPIAIDEKVYVHLKQVPKSFRDLVGFSLSNRDPNTLIPWKVYHKRFKYFSKNFIGKDNIFHFRVKPSGELCFFRNDEHIDSLHVKNIKTPCWAVIELTHITETEELKPSSVEKPSPPTSNTLNEPKRLFGDINNLKLNLTTDREKPESSEAVKPKANIENANRPLDEEGNTPAKQIQPTSSTDVKNKQESADCDVKHFA